ncbi:MAG: hypothetical protein AMXMBFR48_16360 [Ignavibacteriales bacterium]
MKGGLRNGDFCHEFREFNECHKTYRRMAIMDFSFPYWDESEDVTEGFTYRLRRGFFTLRITINPGEGTIKAY